MFEYDIVYPKTVTPQEEVVASGLGFAALRGAGDVIAWGRHPERQLLLVVTPRRKEYWYLVILVSTMSRRVYVGIILGKRRALVIPTNP